MPIRSRDSFLICTVRGRKPGNVVEAYAADGEVSRDQTRWQYFSSGLDAHEWARARGIAIDATTAVILPHFPPIAMKESGGGYRLPC